MSSSTILTHLQPPMPAATSALQEYAPPSASSASTGPLAAAAAATVIASPSGVSMHSYDFLLKQCALSAEYLTSMKQFELSARLAEKEADKWKAKYDTIEQLLNDKLKWIFEKHNNHNQIEQSKEREDDTIQKNSNETTTERAAESNFASNTESHSLSSTTPKLSIAVSASASASMPPAVVSTTSCVSPSSSSDEVEKLKRRSAKLSSRYLSLKRLYLSSLSSLSLSSFRSRFFFSMRLSSILSTKRQIETGAFKASEIPLVTKSGTLIKKPLSTSAVKNLATHKRYFVMIGNSLYYFKNKDEYKPKGVLVLNNVECAIVTSLKYPTNAYLTAALQQPSSSSSISGSSSFPSLSDSSPPPLLSSKDSQHPLAYSFSLNLKEGKRKRYEMGAENETQRDEWLDAICEASVMWWRIKEEEKTMGRDYQLAAEAAAQPPLPPTKSYHSLATIIAPSSTLDSSLVDTDQDLISSILSSLFSSPSVSQSQLSRLSMLLSTNAASPALFCRCLNLLRCRSRRLFSLQNFSAMCSLFDSALTNVFQRQDFRSAKQLLTMSSTFFYVESRGESGDSKESEFGKHLNELMNGTKRMRDLREKHFKFATATPPLGKEKSDKEKEKKERTKRGITALLARHKSGSSEESQIVNFTSVVPDEPRSPTPISPTNFQGSTTASASASASAFASSSASNIPLLPSVSGPDSRIDSDVISDAAVDVADEAHKKYVIDHLRDHKIWLCSKTWENLLFESILTERQKAEIEEQADRRERKKSRVAHAEQPQEEAAQSKAITATNGEEKDKDKDGEKELMRDKEAKIVKLLGEESRVALNGSTSFSSSVASVSTSTSPSPTASPHSSTTTLSPSRNSNSATHSSSAAGSSSASSTVSSPQPHKLRSETAAVSSARNSNNSDDDSDDENGVEFECARAKEEELFRHTQLSAAFSPASAASEVVSLSHPSVHDCDVSVSGPGEERDANIAFSMLLNFAVEMALFKLSYSTVQHFVLRCCIACKVADEKRRLLLGHLNKVYSCIAQFNHIKPNAK